MRRTFMRRREFIAGVGAAVARPHTLGAQQALQPVLGFMSARSPEDSANVLRAFHKGLKEEASFVEGDNISIEYRWARGDYALLPTLAGELVERHVNVLVAVGGDASARAAKVTTSQVPIVFTISGDPVEAGLVQSINRPGGNATGCIVFSTGELDAKRLDFMSEIIPKPSVFGVLVNPKYPPAINQARYLEAAATKIGRVISIAEASNDAELETALSALLEKHIGELVVASDPFFDSRRNRILAFAAEHRLPGIYQFRDYALEGGLISYGPSITDTYRQVGVYAARIVKGGKPVRHAGHAAHEIRPSYQSEDRQRSRPQSAAIATRRRRRSHRMSREIAALQ
jgi:putative tryptophan/tyrosine transport system substrate-binding protein